MNLQLAFCQKNTFVLSWTDKPHVLVFNAALVYQQTQFGVGSGPKILLQTVLFYTYTSFEQTWCNYNDKSLETLGLLLKFSKVK